MYIENYWNVYDYIYIISNFPICCIWIHLYKYQANMLQDEAPQHSVQLPKQVAEFYGLW